MRPARASGFGASGDLAAQRARLREVIAPVVEAAGYDLEELSVSRAGRRCFCDSYTHVDAR